MLAGTQAPEHKKPRQGGRGQVLPIRQSQQFMHLPFSQGDLHTNAFFMFGFLHTPEPCTLARKLASTFFNFFAYHRDLL
jgi:hypothetical protein